MTMHFCTKYFVFFLFAAFPHFSFTAPRPEPEEETILTLPNDDELSSLQNSNDQNENNLVQQIVEQPEDKEVVLGDSVRLKCKVENQKTAVSWYQSRFWLGSDRSMAAYPRYSMVGSAAEGEYDLEIRDVQLSDERAYQCGLLAIPGQLPLKSREAWLTVLVPPAQPRLFDLDLLGQLRGKQDQPFNIRCLIQGGKPAASVEWLLSEDDQGQKIIRILRQQSPTEITKRQDLFDAEASLKFTPDESDDGKFIICRSKHPAMENPMSVAAKLKIKKKPTVSVSLKSAERSMVEDGFALLSCDVNNTEANEAIQYRWYQDGVPIDGDTGAFSTLHLQPLRRALHHNVGFSCRAQNDVGYTEATYRLLMKYPPQFLSEVQKIIVADGESVTLMCLADSNPAPLKYKWTRSGSNSGRWIETFGSNLTIENVKDFHEGVYTCEVFTEMFPKTTQNHQIFVKGLPKVSIYHTTDATQGLTAKIYCKVTGYPLSSHKNVTWYKGRNLVQRKLNHRFDVMDMSQNDEEIFSVLTIKKVNLDDFDTYNCTIYNSIGLNWSATKLIEASSIYMKLMMPGAIVGCLVILVLALCIVCANRSNFCCHRSKGSNATLRSSQDDDQSDLTVKMEELNNGIGSNGSNRRHTLPINYLPEMYANAELLNGKTYIAVPQDNPDFDEMTLPPYQHHFYSSSANGSLIGLHQSAQNFGAKSITPPLYISNNRHSPCNNNGEHLGAVNFSANGNYGAPNGSIGGGSGNFNVYLNPMSHNNQQHHQDGSSFLMMTHPQHQRNNNQNNIIDSAQFSNINNCVPHFSIAQARPVNMYTTFGGRYGPYEQMPMVAPLATYGVTGQAGMMAPPPPAPQVSSQLETVPEVMTPDAAAVEEFLNQNSTIRRCASQISTHV